MLIGYARVSKRDQNLSLQRDALKKAGCERIFTDKVTGATTTRSGLDKAADVLRAGDTLVVWKLDHGQIPSSSHIASYSLSILAASSAHVKK